MNIKKVLLRAVISFRSGNNGMVVANYRILACPEPISIFLAIQMTFYGAAACYRAGTHISLRMFVDMLPPFLKPLQRHFVNLLMVSICLFMVGYGASLVKTTYFQAYPEFQYIRVGVAYSAIPIGGLITLLFVIEQVFIRSPIKADREDKD